MAIKSKRQLGKNIADFNANDWKEIVEESGYGMLKGSIRGASIYTLTNFSATPAATANAIVASSFCVAEQAHLFRKGIIDEIEFINNSEAICLDAVVSGLSSFLGQAIIPIPILGAVIGNSVGILLYQICQNNFDEKEKTLVENYLQEIDQYNNQLNKEYQEIIANLNSSFEQYINLVTVAFSPNLSTALNGSVSLASTLGVPTEELLCTHEQITSYFVD